MNLFIQNFKDNSDKYKILRSVSDPGFTPVFLRQYSSPNHNTILFFTNEFYYRLWFWISSCYGVLGNSKMNIIPPVIELQTLLVLYRFILISYCFTSAFNFSFCYWVRYCITIFYHIYTRFTKFCFLCYLIFWLTYWYLPRPLWGDFSWSNSPLIEKPSISS